jgi:hypothetical protein
MKGNNRIEGDPHGLDMLVPTRSEGPSSNLLYTSNELVDFLMPVVGDHLAVGITINVGGIECPEYPVDDVVSFQCLDRSAIKPPGDDVCVLHKLKALGE